MKPLGVGFIFSKELLPLIREVSETISVVEIEPQTLWQLSRAGGQEAYVPNYELYEALADLPQAKLLHSVGLPVGSSRPLESAQIARLQELVDLVDPRWASEHLSFNAMAESDGWASVGFLLPPLQCKETVEVAAAKLQALGAAVDLPVAFETNVNYLHPQPEELADGDFFAAVAHTAGCGIVLDLHNLWTNELNGRTPAVEVLARLPLDRVWELHLAGGMPYGTQWLDAHSGAIPEPVLEIASEWIPEMPNLGAIVFEITDEYLPQFGMDGVVRQVEAMNRLWNLRSASQEIQVPKLGGQDVISDQTSLAVCRWWECALGGLVVGRPASSPLGARLQTDPGVQLLRELVSDARAGFISQGLRYTMSLLLSACGTAVVRELLKDFMSSCPPELFVSAEADAFARFLRSRPVMVPYLEEVLAFEHALVRATLYGESSTVRFTHEPTSLFESLGQGRLPNDSPHQDFPILIQAY